MFLREVPYDGVAQVLLFRAPRSFARYWSEAEYFWSVMEFEQVLVSSPQILPSKRVLRIPNRRLFGRFTPMIEYAPFALTLSSFLYGLGTSVHCAAMCGPLSVCFLKAGSESQVHFNAALRYHLARLISYTLVGTLAGGIGFYATDMIHFSAGPIVPWLVASLLLLHLMGVFRKVKMLSANNTQLLRFSKWVARQDPRTRAWAFGAMTPLLPCGALYGAILLAVGTAKPWLGATCLALFAFGSAPGLGAAQLYMGVMHRWLGKQWAPRFERLLILTSVALLVWRGVSAMQGPSCHLTLRKPLLCGYKWVSNLRRPAHCVEDWFGFPACNPVC
jgi:uncharacterized protein